AADVVRNARALDRILEIAARQIPGAELEVQHAELELYARQIGVEEQHALQGADRRLVVAARSSLLGELEADLQVAGILEHLLEQRVVIVRAHGSGRHGLALRNRTATARAKKRNQQTGRGQRTEKRHSKTPRNPSGRHAVKTPRTRHPTDGNDIS